jgi:hypothetical protein
MDVETLFDANIEDDPIDLGPGEAKTFSEVFHLNLAAVSGKSFQFTFLASGVGLQSREQCVSTYIYTLVIG